MPIRLIFLPRRLPMWELSGDNLDIFEDRTIAARQMRFTENEMRVSALGANQTFPFKGWTIPVTRQENTPGLKVGGGRRIRGAFTGIAWRDAGGYGATERIAWSTTLWDGEEPVVEPTVQLHRLPAQVGA